MGAPNIRVLIADDHSTSRASLLALLEQDLIHAELSQADSFAILESTLERDLSINMVAVNIQMLGIDGLRRFRLSHPDVRLVVTGSTPNRDVVFGALTAGVHGYVPLDVPAAEIQAAFRSILAGRIYVPPIVTELCLAGRAEQGGGRFNRQIHLTDRQKELLCLLTRGKSNKEMSRTLSIAESTVKVHLAAAYRTLGVFNRLGAVAAFRQLQSGYFPGEPCLPGIRSQSRRRKDPCWNSARSAMN